MKSTLPPEFKKAFKDADIRGLYESEINEEMAYRVARAFVELTQAKKILIGRDMRISSPTLADAFSAGVVDAGATAVDLDLIATPMLYYASGKYQIPGVMVTASHNPKEYNGLKLVLSGAIPVTTKTGLRHIATQIDKNNFTESKRTGKLTEKSISEEFSAYITKKVKAPKKRTVKIVVDVGNGMGSLLLPLLRQYAQVTPLFTKLDGNFPNRDSNPTLKKSQKAIVKELKTGRYDLGIAFDGDADRVAFFDEQGRYLNAAHVGALLASQYVLDVPDAAFVYTVFTSRAYFDAIKDGGSTPVRARVGHSFIKETMRQHDALFGCEHSAHFYYKANYYTDSVTLPVAHVIQTIAVAKLLGKTFSEIIKPYTSYYQTEEILVTVPSRETALRAVKTWGQANQAKVTSFDGVTLDFGDWWTVVKKSVTEDALKFVVESKSKKLATGGQKQIHALLLAMQTQN